MQLVRRQVGIVQLIHQGSGIHRRRRVLQHAYQAAGLKLQMAASGAALLAPGVKVGLLKRNGDKHGLCFARIYARRQQVQGRPNCGSQVDVRCQNLNSKNAKTRTGRVSVVAMSSALIVHSIGNKSSNLPMDAALVQHGLDASDSWHRQPCHRAMH